MADRYTIFVREDKVCKEQTPTVRLVLYALASRVDSKGYCWPSVEQLMLDTGLSRATVFRALTGIRNVLTVDAPGYKHSNSYIFPYQSVDKSRFFVDKSSHGETKVSQGDAHGLTMRLERSHNETGGGLTMRPEVEREDTQEVSLSLTPSKGQDESHSETDNVKYNGTSKPMSSNDMKEIKRWCALAGLDKDHTTDFIRINRLNHWLHVSPSCTVLDLINDFAFKWKKDDPEGFYYYQKSIRSATGKMFA